MTRTPICEGWNLYQDKVIPKDAPELQHQECKRAFFAGAQWLLQIFSFGISDNDPPTKEDEEIYDAIANELDSFVAIDQLKYGETVGNA